MMPGLPVSSLLQCEENHRGGACPELFQAICRFELTFIEAHQSSNIIRNVRSPTSQIKTRSFFEYIITSRNEVINDFEFDIAVRN